MYGPDGPDTFWLNFTNIALGLVTLACVLASSRAAWCGSLLRWQRARGRSADDHAFATPELGLTMADGGERIDQPKPATAKAR